MLIVVTTLSNGTSAAPELISRGFAESDELMAEMRQRGARDRPRPARRRHPRDQAPPGAHPRRHRPARLRPHAPAADDPARRGRGLSRPTARCPTGRTRSPSMRSTPNTAARLIKRLARRCRSRRSPSAGCSSAGRAARPIRRRRAAARRRCAHAADRVETALAGLERAARPLPARARGRRGRGPVVVRRAGRAPSSSTGRRCSSAPASPVVAAPRRGRLPRARRARPRARRALGGGRAGSASPDRGSLWAGLFDLRENLLGRALDDLRALAA